MPSRYRVSCIHRSDRLNHDRRILTIGGVNLDGSRWKVGEGTAIAGIESGRWNFFLSQDERDIEIVVATSRYGSKYLRTVEDNGPHPDGLLSLPECR